MPRWFRRILGEDFWRPFVREGYAGLQAVETLPKHRDRDAVGMLIGEVFHVRKEDRASQVRVRMPVLVGIVIIGRCASPFVMVIGIHDTEEGMLVMVGRREVLDIIEGIYLGHDAEQQNSARAEKRVQLFCCKSANRGHDKLL